MYHKALLLNLENFMLHVKEISSKHVICDINSHSSVSAIRLVSQALVCLKLHQSGTESTYIMYVCTHMYIHMYTYACIPCTVSGILFDPPMYMHNIIIVNMVNNAY